MPKKIDVVPHSGHQRSTHGTQSATSNELMSYLRFVVPAIIALAIVVAEPATIAAQKVDPIEDGQADSPDKIVNHIRTDIQQLLAVPHPELYERHLRSVLALCEDSVLKLRFVEADRDVQAKEMMSYLRTIESGLDKDDSHRSETYLVEGRRSLDLARLSRNDGTLQLYAVSLPAHWDPNKSYPLYVELHGRWSDLPLALVASTFESSGREPNENAIILVPWVRGNSQYRIENGSEPDLWEAIEDLQSFAKLDPDRWYISGHSWGGDDVWAVVLRTPDLWAAAGIMAGSPIGIPKDSGLVSNARSVPFYLWKGEKDDVPNRAEALEEFRVPLTDVGDPPKVVVAPGVGHMYRPEDESAMQKWLFQHVRQRPDHFSFIVDTPRHRGVWGISIPQRYPDAYFNLEPRVSFECWTEGSTVRIKTSNAKRVEVNLGAKGLNVSGDVRVLVNGNQMFAGPVPQKPVSLAW